MHEEMRAKEIILYIHLSFRISSQIRITLRVESNLLELFNESNVVALKNVILNHESDIWSI